MSLSKLSKLPPEVLSSVLNNQAIPLSRRLCLRLLCNRWADIIEDGLKKVTTLVVRDEKADYYRNPEPDDLIIQSPDLTDEFTRLFPSLTQLSINFRKQASWKVFPSLLAHLDNTNLTAVKLYCNGYGQEHNEGITVAIATALTGLSGLTSLTLVGYQISDRFLPHLKPVLSRLEKFAGLETSGDLGGSISSLPSPQLTHFQPSSYTFNFFNSSLLVGLSGNLTHLQLLYCDATTWQSISQMHGLSSLGLEFSNYNLDSSLFGHLASFSRLTDVKLLGLSFHTPLALPSKKETMPSIKRLTLAMLIYCYPVDYLAFFQALSAWFPALLHLTLIVDRDNIAAIQDSLGQLASQWLSVELVDRDLVDTWSTN